jgi:UDP-N-acetylglucosamine 2-epimerase (non-hydrolysing)
LLYPLTRFFNLRIDYDLESMTPNQSPTDVCQRIVRRLLPILDHERPDLILVQGDTATALAGTLAGMERQIPVGHVEAGLRTGDLSSPFPEEGNRQVIGRLATYHFAPTNSNRDALIREGVDVKKIFVTGNPGIDSLLIVLQKTTPTIGLRRLFDATANHKRIVLTAHRRENFGTPMEGCFTALRRFVETHADVAVVFPVHPNPAIATAANVLRGHSRIHVIEPLGYPDFIHLMHKSWLIVSDSGGVQEEVPSLGRRLLILRRNTERPEAVFCDAARLVGTEPESLTAALEDSLRQKVVFSWRTRPSPFGTGDSGEKIFKAIQLVLGTTRT